MRRILAAIAASAVGLVLAVGVSPRVTQAHGGSGGYTPPPIQWDTCRSAGLQARGAQCGFVTVPLDYDRPGGTKIKLAVSRIKAKSPAANYQGVMLTNPGGPGASGLTLAALGEFVPNRAGEDYDWIGFDPRGVGSSEPALSCDSQYFGYNRPYFVPVTESLETTWLARTEAYAKACDRAGGALLEHLKTTDTVSDMESIRTALGAEQINFYGFSYGTYLGQVYATLHPDRVRRMVLDSNVNPGRVWYESNLDQNIPFDENLDVFFAWVGKYDSVYHLGTSAKVVKGKYYDTLRKLRRAPAAGKIGPAEWTDIFQAAGHDVFAWQRVAAAFSAWVNEGDVEPLLARYRPPGGAGADNGYAIYLGVQCTDAQWPTNWSRWKRDNWKIYVKHPFLTWSNAWFNAPCRSWGAKAGKPVQVDGSNVPPILLISETHDAATPFTGSLEVRKRFPNSVLIEGLGGTTHSSSLFGVACTDDTIAAYLQTGVLPQRLPGNRSDKQCDPLPQPVATPAATAKTFTTPDITRADLQELIGR